MALAGFTSAPTAGFGGGGSFLAGFGGGGTVNPYTRASRQIARLPGAQRLSQRERDALAVRLVTTGQLGRPAGGGFLGALARDFADVVTAIPQSAVFGARVATLVPGAPMWAAAELPFVRDLPGAASARSFNRGTVDEVVQAGRAVAADFAYRYGDPGKIPGRFMEHPLPYLLDLGFAYSAAGKGASLGARATGFGPTGRYAVPAGGRGPRSILSYLGDTDPAGRRRLRADRRIDVPEGFGDDLMPIFRSRRAGSLNPMTNAVQRAVDRYIDRRDLARGGASRGPERLGSFVNPLSQVGRYERAARRIGQITRMESTDQARRDFTRVTREYQKIVRKLSPLRQRLRGRGGYEEALFLHTTGLLDFRALGLRDGREALEGAIDFWTDGIAEAKRRGDRVTQSEKALEKFKELRDRPELLDLETAPPLLRDAVAGAKGLIREGQRRLETGQERADPGTGLLTREMIEASRQRLVQQVHEGSIYSERLERPDMEVRVPGFDDPQSVRQLEAARLALREEIKRIGSPAKRQEALAEARNIERQINDGIAAFHRGEREEGVRLIREGRARLEALARDSQARLPGGVSELGPADIPEWREIGGIERARQRANELEAEADALEERIRPLIDFFSSRSGDRAARNQFMSRADELDRALEDLANRSGAEGLSLREVLMSNDLYPLIADAVRPSQPVKWRAGKIPRGVSKAARALMERVNAIDQKLLAIHQREKVGKATVKDVDRKRELQAERAAVVEQIDEALGREAAARNAARGADLPSRLQVLRGKAMAGRVKPETLGAMSREIAALHGQRPMELWQLVTQARRELEAADAFERTPTSRFERATTEVESGSADVFVDSGSSSARDFGGWRKGEIVGDNLVVNLARPGTPSAWVVARRDTASRDFYGGGQFGSRVPQEGEHRIIFNADDGWRGIVSRHRTKKEALEAARGEAATPREQPPPVRPEPREGLQRWHDVLMDAFRTATAERIALIPEGPERDAALRFIASDEHPLELPEGPLPVRHPAEVLAALEEISGLRAEAEMIRRAMDYKAGASAAELEAPEVVRALDEFYADLESQFVRERVSVSSRRRRARNAQAPGPLAAVNLPKEQRAASRRQAERMFGPGAAVRNPRRTGLSDEQIDDAVYAELGRIQESNATDLYPTEENIALQTAALKRLGSPEKAWVAVGLAGDYAGFRRMVEARLARADADERVPDRRERMTPVEEAVASIERGEAKGLIALEKMLPADMVAEHRAALAEVYESLGAVRASFGGTPADMKAALAELRKVRKALKVAREKSTGGWTTPRTVEAMHAQIPHTPEMNEALAAIERKREQRDDIVERLNELQRIEGADPDAAQEVRMLNRSLARVEGELDRAEVNYREIESLEAVKLFGDITDVDGDYWAMRPLKGQSPKPQRDDRGGRPRPQNRLSAERTFRNRGKLARALNFSYGRRDPLNMVMRGIRAEHSAHALQALIDRVGVRWARDQFDDRGLLVGRTDELVRGEQVTVLMRQSPDLFRAVHMPTLSKVLERLREDEVAGEFDKSRALEAVFGVDEDDVRANVEAGRWRADDVVLLPKAAVDEYVDAAHGIFRGYDNALGLWKAGVLVFTPRWYVLNLIGNSMQYGLLSGGDLRSVLLAGLGSKIALGKKRRAKYREIEQRLAERVPEELASVSQASETGVAEGVARLGNVADRAFEFNQTLEALLRRAAYINSAKRQLKYAGRRKETRRAEDIIAALDDIPDVTREAALREALFFLGDYRKFNRFERGFVRRIMPFYSWVRVISRLTLGLPFNSPIRAEVLSVLATATQAEWDPLEEALELGRPLFARGGIDIPDEVPLIGGTTLRTTALNPFATTTELYVRPLEALGREGPSAALGEAVQSVVPSLAPGTTAVIEAATPGFNVFGNRAVSAPAGYGGLVQSFGGSFLSPSMSGYERTSGPAVPFVENLLQSFLPYYGSTARSLLAGSDRPFDTATVPSLIAARLGLSGRIPGVYDARPGRVFRPPTGYAPIVRPGRLTPLSSLLGFPLEHRDEIAEAQARLAEFERILEAREQTEARRARELAQLGVTP